ncbi:MAG: thermostable hemolysin [Alphaproteobacteria bacterium]|nr:thermostable hemolysin [Alphaproteobacteria bacterium]MBU1513196.1 thermostable hemolysin [Alphaproteobacteria bacterium]MBU2095304.1 thermostable hemolysin [Alphaproteobacteria bacterium]MBU2152219.1 thermostable hemolysin [Alphaproteobacteria bacterium]MBU2306734.1 thermostable hemolysin [Alphaproteobacteria bacterium]
MSQALPTSNLPCRRDPSSDRQSTVLFADADHQRRRDIELFVEARFARAFGACLPRHHSLLACLCADDADGPILAAAGLRFAEDGPLFLEQYLDRPVEHEVAAAFGRPVDRNSIVEIGSLASDTPDASLGLFSALAPWLAAERRRRFAVATVRPEVERLLGRAGFGLTAIGQASPDRLGGDAGEWGSYYDRRPRIFVGEIGDSRALPLLRQRLRAKTMDRAVRRLRSVAP